MAGRDLLRAEQGTWLGITREGRLAVLTNFREEGDSKPEAKSRGALVNAFLTQPADNEEASTEDFVKSVVSEDGLKGFGGFSLVCGRVGEALAVFSNRTPDVGGVSWIGGTKAETVGLSNATIGDRSWTKVTEGENLVAKVIEEDVAANGSKEALVDALFRVLSRDTLPQFQRDLGWESQVKELRKSIFIPAVNKKEHSSAGAQDLAAADTSEQLNVHNPEEIDTESLGMSGAYGTQKQTIILATHDGQISFVERTMYDSAGNSVDQRRDFSLTL